MTSTRYWASGITVAFDLIRWSAWVDYFEDGSAEDMNISTDWIRGAGVEALTEAVYTIKAEAEQLGVAWRVLSQVRPSRIRSARLMTFPGSDLFISA